MGKLSKKTLMVVRDHVADALYNSYPAEMSTYNVALNVGRGRGVVRALLGELKGLGVVQEILKDKRGFPLAGERRKWKLKFEYVRALKKKGF
jgi:hypothetical protein